MLFSKGVGKDKKLPVSLEELDVILAKAYKANTFWNRLTKLCSKTDQFFIPNEIDKNSKYLLSKNKLIISDNLLYGLGFMKVLFDNLNKQK